MRKRIEPIPAEQEDNYNLEVDTITVSTAIPGHCSSTDLYRATQDIRRDIEPIGN